MLKICEVHKICRAYHAIELSACTLQGELALAPGRAYHALDLNDCTLMEMSLRSGRNQGKLWKMALKKKRIGHPVQFMYHFDFVLIWL